jgi:L-2-hydroxyglutarate oxidase LhgO
MAETSLPDLETVVIGGGVIGLAVARALAMAGEEVTLLEQNGGLAQETSARNSGVIHAGIYYPPGSLRARFCVAGKELLYPFLERHGVPHRRLGKLLVATSEADLPKLASYAETARLNGVDDLQPLTGAQARALEPEVRCSAALLSPSTGIIDAPAYAMALAGEAEAHGAQLLLHSRVLNLRNTINDLFSFSMDGGETISCRQLVIAGGLHTSRLASTLTFQGYRPPPTFFARGRWYALAGKSPFQRLVYPMPHGSWLGTHSTLDMAGRCKFGPDIEWIDGIDYAFDEGAETAFYAAIRAYWPGLPDGAQNCRAKANRSPTSPSTAPPCTAFPALSCC